MSLHSACMNIIELTAQQLRQAATLKDQIEALESELNQLLGGEVPAPVKVDAEAPKALKKRRMSAAGRAAIAAGVRARWAKLRGSAGLVPSAKPGLKPKVRRSAAWRAAVSAAAKARWAKAKKAGKSRW
jgi:hypothetical protein